jgi:UPF0716 protein FxsA
MRLALFAFLWFCAEIVTLIEVGRAIGAIDTLVLLLLGSGIGAALLRAEGLAFFTRLASTMQRYAVEGEMPPLPLADALPRFLAGALFLLPGFLSDAVAVLVLLPPARGAIARRARRWIEDRHHAALARTSFTAFDIEGEVSSREEERGEGRDPPRRPRRIT